MKIALKAGWAESCGISAGEVLGPDFDVVHYHSGELSADLAAELGDIEALVPVMASVDESVMRALPRLRVIAPPGTGVWDYVDVPMATSRGIAVCNIRDYATDAIVEFVLGAMIALNRRMRQAEQSLKAGRWEPEVFKGRELHGSTLGIIGLGTVGSRIAALGNTLGMRVMAHTKHPDSGYARTAGVELVDLRHLLERSDVITVHARLTDQTEGMLGERELSWVKPGAIFINTARGALVDQQALAAALEDGRLSAAALDVFSPEPPSTSDRLIQLDNVLATPHIAAGTERAIQLSARLALENVVGFSKGKPINVVNPEVLLQNA